MMMSLQLLLYRFPVKGSKYLFRSDRYISEALDPVVKFKAYKAFDSGAIRKFYSPPQSCHDGRQESRPTWATDQ